MNTLAADTVAHPAPEEGAGDGAEARGDQDQRRLPIGNFPVLENERQHIPDQKEIEKVEHVTDISRGDDLPLIGCQLFLTLQTFQHDLPPGWSAETATRCGHRREAAGS